MAFQRGQKLPKGLDDGVRVTKSDRKKQKLAAEEKQKVEDPTGQAAGHTKEKVEDAVTGKNGETYERPKIRPGERMSEFAARVDAALPVSGLINKSVRQGKDPLGLKVGRTKTEKRMHRMYDEWREEEKRIQEKKMEALELAEEDEMAEDEDGQMKWKVDLVAAQASTAGKKGKKGKGKKKVLGEVEDGEDDPWAKIKRDRDEGKRRFNDVVQAPPTFTKVPKEKFKVRGAAVDVGDVPKASGSLRRREELGSVRRSVVEGYRQMLKDNRDKKE